MSKLDTAAFPPPPEKEPFPTSLHRRRRKKSEAKFNWIIAAVEARIGWMQERRGGGISAAAIGDGGRGEEE